MFLVVFVVVAVITFFYFTCCLFLSFFGVACCQSGDHPSSPSARTQLGGHSIPSTLPHVPAIQLTACLAENKQLKLEIEGIQAGAERLKPDIEGLKTRSNALCR